MPPLRWVLVAVVALLAASSLALDCPDLSVASGDGSYWYGHCLANNTTEFKESCARAT
jgi:hypothetical protein